MSHWHLLSGVVVATMSEIEHGMSADSDVIASDQDEPDSFFDAENISEETDASAGVSTGHLSSSALSNLALNSEEIASYRLGDESRARE